MRAMLSRLELEIKHQYVGTLNWEGVLAIATTLKERIAEADFATRLYVLEQLDLSCQVNKQRNDHNATVTCGLGQMPEQKEWSIATNHLITGTARFEILTPHQQKPILKASGSLRPPSAP